MSNDHILVERRAQVGIITFNRPEVRNALTEEMWDRFPHLVKQVAADPHSSPSPSLRERVGVRGDLPHARPAERPNAFREGKAL